MSFLPQKHADGLKLFIFKYCCILKLTEIPDLFYSECYKLEGNCTPVNPHSISRLWFYSVKYPIGPDGDFPLVLHSTLCQSKLYNPAALTDPNTPYSILPPQNHTVQTGTLAVSSRTLYKCFTTDVIWLGKYFVYCVLASCAAAVSKVTLCFEWEWLFFFLFCFMADFGAGFIVNVASYSEALWCHKVQQTYLQVK